MPIRWPIVEIDSWDGDFLDLVEEVCEQAEFFNILLDDETAQ